MRSAALWSVVPGALARGGPWPTAPLSESVTSQARAQRPAWMRVRWWSRNVVVSVHDFYTFLPFARLSSAQLSNPIRALLDPALAEGKLDREGRRRARRTRLDCEEGALADHVPAAVRVELTRVGLAGAWSASSGARPREFEPDRYQLKYPRGAPQLRGSAEHVDGGVMRAHERTMTKAPTTPCLSIGFSSSRTA